MIQDIARELTHAAEVFGVKSAKIMSDEGSILITLSKEGVDKVMCVRITCTDTESFEFVVYVGTKTVRKYTVPESSLARLAALDAILAFEEFVRSPIQPALQYEGSEY